MPLFSASMEFRLPTLAISDLVNALHHGGNEIAGGITSDPYGMGRKWKEVADGVLWHVDAY